MSQNARSRVPSLLLLFLVLTVVVVNASNWFILSRVAESLDEGLGLRLTTVAASAVRSATAELLLAPDVDGDLFVRGILEDIAAQQDLEDVFLVDPSGTVLLDLNGDGVGRQHPFVELDGAAFASAVAGTSAASPAVEVDGVLLKAAYAPVADWDGGVEAALGVTAGGGFYARVPALRRTLLAVALGSAALVALLGVFFFGMSRRLSRTEAALSRSETLSAMGIMAAGVAHEVRNPLAIISGTASRLKRKYGGGGEDPLFDFIPEEVDRLNRILEGYLRFARDEPIAVEECDLRDVVERSGRLVLDEFETAGVTVDRRLGDVPVVARVDARRIQQVLLNLLLNGAQAMPGGGELALDLRTAGGRAVLEVADRGPGFSAKDLAAAFEPFHTTKEQGSGLGLVMAKRIVEAHDGTITIANRDGGGAVATVELPLAGPRRAAGEEN